MLLMVEWHSWFAALAPAKTKQTNKKKWQKRKQKPFGRLTCTITDPIVCVRGSVCESDEQGRGGVERVAVKREVKTMILPLFSTTSSPLKTHHMEMEKRSDVTSITQQEIWTWAVYLAWPIGWSISKQEVNAAYWPELQEVDLSRKREALRSLLLDIWMDIICFCTFTRTVFIYVCSPHLLTSTKWLTMFTWSLFVWSCVLLAFLSVIPSAVHLQIRLVED